MTITAQDAAALAETVLAARSASRLIEPISASRADFDMSDAEAIAERILALRVAQGETRIGRKIGFTNRAMWETYGVTGPIWGDMFDTTVVDVPADPIEIALPPLPQPRIEPEIVFGLRTAPDDPDMSLADLATCIDWVAHGYELVSAIYPNWQQSAADAHAACGMHGVLYVGPRQDFGALGSAPDVVLAELQLTLTGGDVVATGKGRVVLDGPLHALRHLVSALDAMGADPLAAGDVVTTGTLTDAFPITAGERWRSQISNDVLPGLDVTFGAAATM